MSTGYQLRIRHTTGYAYADGSSGSYNEARMTPLTTSDQTLLRSRLEISPTPWTLEYRDYWGSTVTAFEVHEDHDALEVVATSTVETSGSVAQPGRTGWGDLAAVSDEWCEYLMASPWTSPPEELLAELEPLRASSETPADFARAVGRYLHESIAYLPGTTSVESTASDAWASRSGVCQDFAHLMLGVLRVAGIPARYVAGYLHPSSDPQVGETVEGESHAWVEWFDGEWIGWDPTNDIAPSGRHVMVARGRDYSDNPPLRGIYAAGSSSELFVSVEITRLR
ncbi:transglutaminase family protein [Aeromicrobium alkaliterrae]|uniref:Transglutaminase family protein n=1 Tax=Aeromicrobium alkaliterrae TaxID=302168 RepID=A0ABP4W2C3_9ACTN